MLPGFKEFEKKLREKEIKTKNPLLNKTVQSFDLHQILDNELDDQQIIQRINESKIIVVDHYFKNNVEYILICFDKQLIILEKSHQSIIQTLLSKNNEDKIYIIPKFNNNIQAKSTTLSEKMSNFIENFEIKAANKGSIIYTFWKIIQPCLCMFLIKKSCIESYKDRIDDFLNNMDKKNQPKYFNENEFILLKLIKISESSKINLYYHIESESLCIIKDFYNQNFNLEKREIDNYKFINFPFVPKFYGLIRYLDRNLLVIEYIRGQTLIKYLNQKINFEQKLSIVIEILFTFQYLHRNKLIYRDLKPDNIMIDKNNHVILIDFDRMIQKSEEYEYDEYTKDLTSYADLELKKSIPSFENDIYSIGKMILFIFDNDEILDRYPNIHDIAMKCLNQNLKERPSISNLLDFFYVLVININNMSLFKKFSDIYFIDTFLLKLQKNYINAMNYAGYNYLTGDDIAQDINKSIYYLLLSADKNDSYAQLLLGQIYHEGKYIKRDINKAIYYYSLAANQNDPDAQFRLGNIYFEGEYVKQDIDKSLYYLTLSADQNQPDAQFYLGIIYNNGNYIKQNVNKSIHYMTLASNQNHPYAQYNLGKIYLKGEYTPRDINKSIHYLSLAADQNNVDAQNLLGKIYFDGEYITQDIKKSIDYYTLAADQNHSGAQLCLGILYYKNNYFRTDINKSIYYLSLSAKQNNSMAQFYLGEIFYNGIYIERNIDLSIHYYLLAANQNDPTSQYMLGRIYYEGKYVTRDIKKSIHFFSLASNQKHSQSQFYLATIYYNGKYVHQNINKVIHYLTLAANSNYVNAQLYLGLIYYEGKHIAKDINKSLYFFFLAAKQHDSNAQYFIGIIFFNGDFVVKDINKSIYFLSLAANQNHSNALFMLGYIYYFGNNIKKDIEKSFHYLLLSSNQNNSNAQYFIGLIYYHGNSFMRDINKSIYYLSLAANQNHSYAFFTLGEIYFYGEYVTKNINKAIQYFSRAANLNHSGAQFYLGLFYLDGLHLPQSDNKGSYYLYLSANQGNVNAQFLLGVFYLKSNDIKNSIHYYKEASSLNHHQAKNNLAIIYKNGIGTQINLWYSIELFNEAIKMDDIASMYNLAHLCFYNKIDEIDFDYIIDLLIRSYDFYPSKLFLCIVLCKKYKVISKNLIENEIKCHKFNKPSQEIVLINDILQCIDEYEMENESNYEYLYDKIRYIDFIYDLHLNINYTSSLIREKQKSDYIEKSRRNINQDFYEGFGISFD